MPWIHHDGPPAAARRIRGSHERHGRAKNLHLLSRDDCQSQANGLNDGLRHRFPEARVFMDIDSIPIGADFEEHIRGEIEQCHVALILIGDNWLEARPGTDNRRIDESNDFVRMEVESALAAKHLRVIPVLVEGARMPTPEELPGASGGLLV